MYKGRREVEFIFHFLKLEESLRIVKRNFKRKSKV